MRATTTYRFHNINYGRYVPSINLHHRNGTLRSVDKKDMNAGEEGVPSKGILLFQSDEFLLFDARGQNLETFFDVFFDVPQ